MRCPGCEEIVPKHGECPRRCECGEYWCESCQDPDEGGCFACAERRRKHTCSLCDTVDEQGRVVNGEFLCRECAGSPEDDSEYARRAA